MKIITLKCNHCNKEFEKQLKEYNRQIKKNSNYKFYCSRTCTGKGVNVKNFITSKGNRLYTSNLVQGSKKDEYSPFRIHMKSVRNRVTKKINIDEKYLKEIWDNQKGVCSYLKIKLNHRTNKAVTDPLYTASLDRIDSSKGYVKDNVQFISLMCNYAKNKFDEKYLFNFFDIIKGLN